MHNSIEIAGLKKSFGDIKAVDGISFSVREGSLFAFLGENGAGKSTTINIICTLLGKDAGKVIVAGSDIDVDPVSVRGSIGVVFQTSALDGKLTVKDNLSVRASFYGISGKAAAARLDEIKEMFDLGDLMKRPYGKLSGGQRRRVDIARALIHKPKILILDEPTTGLDPQTRRTVWGVIKTLRKESDMTVLLTTHYMEEANQAESVVIIDSGRVVADGSPVELKNKYSGDYIKIYGRQGALDDALAGCDFSYDDNCYRVKIAGSNGAKAFIAKHGGILNDFEVIKGDMDDVFLNVTGKKLEGGITV